MERPYRPLIRESGFRRILRNLARFAFYPPLAAVLIPLYGLRVENRQRLAGPGISVMNHCIHVEWFFLWHAARPGFIRFTAEEANMRRLDGAWFNWALGVVGIPAEHPMAVAPAVEEALKRGELIHFFPEGILRPGCREPGEFMIGAAWFACRHEVPLVPVAEILLPRNSRFPGCLPPRVRLVVGDPLIPADYREKGDTIKKNAARLNRAAERFIRSTLAGAAE